MCLETTQKRAKIAKEDIHCYKVMRVVNTHIRSIYQYHRYYINKLETIDKFGIVKYSTFVFIDEGLHAYISLETALCRTIWNTGILYNCTIPKGSKYYLGNDDDIVSNQMMINGRYKEKK